MENQIVSKVQHTYEEKLKAAYALNMCTVSISQIVDYNDLYVLEQEYDAILNNLNLKEMPKDEALLRIISEILNTITFFRIQEVKKNQIEKKYKQRLKNAIWSAIPSLSVIVPGNPATIALSLATQIGTGYMNYRKEKAESACEKEDAEIELQITAIEQINALRRELFTTAWRLADAYDFKDEWRLTEKQISQYNAILKDPDEYRRYARMEAVSDRFFAYPPFWYFYGHTANYIAEMARNRMRALGEKNDDNLAQYDQFYNIVNTYTGLAKQHYEHYYKLCNNNILREDQLTASFALEYVDILWYEESQQIEKILELLKLAERMAPNSFDILQLCAISYLKIGSTNDAARLLKILVNEDYNATSNAKMLSKIYVSTYLATENEHTLSNYRILEQQIDPLYLYPMPNDLAEKSENQCLDSTYMAKQKAIVKKAYRITLDAFAKKNIGAFNAVLPAARNNIDNQEEYFSVTEAAKKQRIEDARKTFGNSHAREYYILAMKDRGFRYEYISILNRTISELETLSCFRSLETHDALIKIVEARLRSAKSALAALQMKIDEGVFSFDDYLVLSNDYSYQYFCKEFFHLLKSHISKAIDSICNMSDLDTYDFELTEFCDRNGLTSPEEYLHIFRESDHVEVSPTEQVFFDGKLLGVDDDNSNSSASSIRAALLQIVKEEQDKVILNSKNTFLHLLGDKEFDFYFQNKKLKVQSGSIYLYKQKAFAILDDKTNKDYDLVFCVDGVIPVVKNTMRDIVDYWGIVCSKEASKSVLLLNYPDEYANKNVDIAALKSIIDRIRAKLRELN